MAELDAKIVEARQWRRMNHVAKRFIEAAAAAIRERALLEAKIAIMATVGPRPTLRELGWRSAV